VTGFLRNRVAFLIIAISRAFFLVGS